MADNNGDNLTLYVFVVTSHIAILTSRFSGRTQYTTSSSTHQNVPRTTSTDGNSGDNLSHRPKRITRLPPKYDDYVNSDVLIQQLLAVDDEDITVSIDRDRPFTSVVDTISSTNAIICSLRDDDATDPQTITDAKRSSYWAEWLSAINSELESLKAKGVYEEVHVLPPHRKPVQCKWVLHIKRDKDGTISRFKARLVAKGFTQIPGQDFTFTFAPVARWDSIRALLCIAATKDFEI